MQLHPTRPAVDLAIAGIVAVGVGVLFREAAIVAWSGALLVGLAIARSVTALGVARIRAAGFEMLWRGNERKKSLARGTSIELEAELRNRDTRAARFVTLRPIHSPNLDVSLQPTRGEVPAGGRLRVIVKVKALRVGAHGIHGLSLEVRGGPGLFEVPLTFSNPYGLNVLPRSWNLALRSARGGRTRTVTDLGGQGRLPGEGMELRELRDHQPGDPFKRIAWKASARRGRLLVRDYEREERELVWVVVDASVELWSGKAGTAPLDLAIDDAATTIQRHISNGDWVGLSVIGARVMTWIPPGRGVAHAAQLMNALALETATLDVDRSDLDEMDVAQRVIEHLRPLDPVTARGVHLNDLDHLARRAGKAIARAPFSPREPLGANQRDRALRRYLAAFGMESPSRIEGDRPHTDKILKQTLNRLWSEKPRPSTLYIFAPPPHSMMQPAVEKILRKYGRSSSDIRWISSTFEQSLPHEDSPILEVVSEAMAVRARLNQERGERALRNLGVRVTRRPRPRAL